MHDPPVVHVLNRQQRTRRVKAGQRQATVAQAAAPFQLQVHRQIGLVRQQHVQVGFGLERRLKEEARKGKHLGKGDSETSWHDYNCSKVVRLEKKEERVRKKVNEERRLYITSHDILNYHKLDVPRRRF